MRQTGCLWLVGRSNETSCIHRNYEPYLYISTMVRRTKQHTRDELFCPWDVIFSSLFFAFWQNKRFGGELDPAAAHYIVCGITVRSGRRWNVSIALSAQRHGKFENDVICAQKGQRASSYISALIYVLRFMYGPINAFLRLLFNNNLL